MKNDQVKFISISPQSTRIISSNYNFTINITIEKYILFIKIIYSRINQKLFYFALLIRFIHFFEQLQFLDLNFLLE